MEFLAIIIIIIIAKPLIKAICLTLQSNVPAVISNVGTGLANSTMSLPTLGASVAAQNLIELEDELVSLNAEKGTNYASYMDVINKYKKIGS